MFGRTESKISFVVRGLEKKTTTPPQKPLEDGRRREVGTSKFPVKSFGEFKKGVTR